MKRLSTSETDFAKWKLYAAAAGATLAMSTNVQASIVASGPIDLTAQAGGTHGMTNAIQTQIDGQLFIAQVVLKSSHRTSVGVANLGASFYFATTGGVLKRYHANSSIQFDGGGNIGLLRSAFIGQSGGNFGPGAVTGFVGFGDTAHHFGWIKVEVSDTGTPGFPNEVQVLGWAYDTTANEAILAGDTGATSAPEPGTIGLSLLALGASGIAAWRKARASGGGSR